MAAVARFISFDGGIAFSTASLKIQKRDEELGKIIPVTEIAALEVSEPLFGDDGSITVRLNGERRASRGNTLYFDEGQYEEAVQFKVAFDTMREESRPALPPLDMFQPTALAPARKAVPRSVQRPARPRPEVRREYEEPARPQRRRPAKKSKLKKIILWVVGVYVALLGVGGIALLFGNESTKDEAAGDISTAEPGAVSEAWVPQNDMQTMAPKEGTSTGNKFELDISKLSLDDIGPIDTGDLELEFGELVEVSYGGDGVVVVKGKINSSYNNEDAIEQNYFSVCDLITEHGFDSCSELQYWAVADTQSGEESKAISFTLDKPAIQAVKNEQIVATQLGDYATDLWVLPSLREGVDGLAISGSSGQTSSSDGVEEMTAVSTSLTETGTSTVGVTSPPRITAQPAPTDPPVTAEPEQQTEQLVWIPTKGGHKYHSNSGCSNMDGPRQVSISEAVSLGFTPCKRCY